MSFAAELAIRYRERYRGLHARYLVALVILLTSAAAATNDAPGFQDRAEFEQQLEATDNEIRELDALLNSTRTQRQELKAKLQEHTGRLQDRTQRLQQLQKETQIYEARLSELENRVLQQQTVIGEDREQLAILLRQRLISNYSGQTQNAVKAAFSGKDISLSQRKAVYIAHLENARKDRIANLQHRVAKLEQAHHEALKSRNWLAHLRRKAKKQHADINQQRNETTASIDKLTDKEQLKLHQREQLLEQQKDIESILLQLDQMRTTVSGYFAAHQGKLPWPVSKNEKPQLLARFGDKKAGGKLAWTGTLIQRKQGQTVHAIADGEVVYADQLAAMGMVVVIDHGDSYLSLYGGNRSIKVLPGDWVEMGSTIATVGRITSPNAESTYLEIRENANPVDPETWLSKKKPVQLAKN